MGRGYVATVCLVAGLAIAVALTLMFPFWQRDARVELGGGIAAGTLVGVGLFVAQLAIGRRAADDRMVKALAALDERFAELGERARLQDWSVERVEAAAYRGVVPDVPRGEYAGADMQGRDLKELEKVDEVD